MPVERGQAWGAPGALPAGGVVVHSDAEAREVLEAARREKRPYPVLGLLGGDLCRTLGGRGDEGRLRSSDAMTFPVDLGEAMVDGRLHLFVAHLVARNRTWTRVFAACNAEFVGPWDAAPRSHPNDGLLDCYDCRVPLADIWKVRNRLRLGAHLPHPGIKEQRAPAVQVDLGKPLGIWVDGTPIGPGREVWVRVEPDALRVVV